MGVVVVVVVCCCCCCCCCVVVVVDVRRLLSILLSLCVKYYFSARWMVEKAEREENRKERRTEIEKRME